MAFPWVGEVNRGLPLRTSYSGDGSLLQPDALFRVYMLDASHLHGSDDQDTLRV